MKTKTLAEQYGYVLNSIKQSPYFLGFGCFHFIEKAAELSQDYFWQLLIGYSEFLDFEEARPLIETAHMKADKGIRYYESGVLKECREYKNGLPHGISRYYSPNGVLHCDAMYKNGKAHGFFNTYHDNGVLCERSAYENDAFISIVGTYNRKGRPLKEYHGYGRRVASTIADIAGQKPSNIPVYIFKEGKHPSVHFIILNKNRSNELWAMRCQYRTRAPRWRCVFDRRFG